MLDRRNTYYIETPHSTYVMGILLDPIELVLIVVLVLVAVALFIHLLPLLVFVALILLVVWLLFFRKRPR